MAAGRAVCAPAEQLEGAAELERQQVVLKLKLKLKLELSWLAGQLNALDFNLKVSSPQPTGRALDSAN